MHPRQHGVLSLLTFAPCLWIFQRSASVPMPTDCFTAGGGFFPEQFLGKQTLHLQHGTLPATHALGRVLDPGVGWRVLTAGHCLHLSCQDGATSTHPLVYSLEVGKTVHWEIWLVTLPFEAILSHPLKGTEVTPWVREESTVEDAQEPIGERGARVGGTAGAPSLKPEPVHLAQEVNTLWLPPRPGTWLRADTQGPTATPWGDPPLGRGLGRSQGSGQKPVA